MKYFIILPFLMAVGYGFPKFNENQGTLLRDAVNNASMKIFKESYQNSEGKNVIVSPLSVLTLLSELSAGNEGKSREEIMQFLAATDYTQLSESYGNLTKKYSSMDHSDLVLANKIYVSDKYTLNDQFSNVARQSYNSELEQVDFEEKTATANNIKRWADEKTNGHIKSPVDEQTIDENAAAALFNVMFFQGHWQFPFNAELTKEKDFYVNESVTVKRPMMRLKSYISFRGNQELGAWIMQLPYKENGFRMIVFLPYEKNGLAGMVEKLAQKGVLHHVIELGVAEREIGIQMPKFDIKHRLDLNNILSKVGVSRIFSEETRGIVREQVVTVSKTFQEAFIKVDEEGTTAGAFTGHVVQPLTSPYIPLPPLELKMNYPFMFAILHVDIVLFTGTFTY